MAKADIRDVSPLLQKVRNFLLGRQHTLALRFQKDVATRSPPLPDIPDGPCHKLNSNYYFSRDARREVPQPEIVAAGTKRLAASSTTAEPAKSVAPGNVYLWD